MPTFELPGIEISDSDFELPAIDISDRGFELQVRRSRTRGFVTNLYNAYKQNMATNLIQKHKMIFFVVTLLIHNVYSFMDMEELKSIYYGLDILNEPVVINQALPLGAVHVTSKYGQQYQCTFLDHNSEDKKKEEEEKIAIETGIVEMLKPMGLKDCLFKSKDWWSYEFCYGKHIRQFHMEDGEIKGNIIYLGYYESDFDWNNETAREDRLRSKVSMSRYHSQTYTLGTKCDLTNQMRKTEVRFMCEENSEDYLYRIDESETCVYTVIIMTSRICSHPFLKAPVKRQPVPITCNPLLTEDQYQDFLANKAEEEKKAEEKKLKEIPNTLTKEDTSSSLSLDQQLQKTLDNEMSNAAKALLTESPDELFSHGDAKPMTKEEFERLFGHDEQLWELYLRGNEITQKQQDIKKLMDMKKETGGDFAPSKEKDAADEEDEEILSKFDEEIKEIKKKFESSQNKLASIKKKITLDRQWESEIENAIKEAEVELGVKVDRSLISGLSNTLDKLFNKLQDTEAELSTMNKEIGKLQSSEMQAKKDEDQITEIDEADKTDVTVTEESEEDEDKKDPAKVVKDPPQVKDGSVGNLDEKVLAPPKTLSKHSGTKDANLKSLQPGDELNDDREQEPSTGIDGSEKADPDGKVALQKVGKDDLNLPKNLQKLLEESVLKEYQKHKLQQDDSKPLRFDTDHSFTKDKMFHVIQQEDEDGKTNRFIFVFGFNAFSDESAEQERQSSLEENYSFVYKGKKNTNSKEPSS
ncbi:Protein OS-9 [Bulinus truncatus]|nr:Protein OS-9 [Bulinus truncatus]